MSSQMAHAVPTLEEFIFFSFGISALDCTQKLAQAMAAYHQLKTTTADARDNLAKATQAMEKLKRAIQVEKDVLKRYCG